MGQFDRWRNFVRLPLRAQVGIVQVVLLYLAAEVALRCFPTARAARYFGVPVTMHQQSGRRCQPALTVREKRLASTAVRVACRVYGRDRGCLRRALVIGFILRRHNPSLRLGVLPHGSKFVSHAWVQVGGFDLEPTDNLLGFNAGT
jgi:hypothetical protein